MSPVTAITLMASFNRMSNRWQRNKPWKARVKVDWVEQFLGYFETREEAEQVEEEYRAAK